MKLVFLGNNLYDYFKILFPKKGTLILMGNQYIFTEYFVY